MADRPRLLDLFCGAGGAAMGYHRAGFDVVGVDNRPQPNYPFEFIQCDALKFFRSEDWVRYGWRYDAIHASPPCQSYSKAMRHLAAPQPQLIEPVRELLQATGLPWIIENVPGAPLATGDTLDGRHGCELCGTMFGLRIRRHRLFETNFSLAAPTASCSCARSFVLNPHNHASRQRIYAAYGRQDPEKLWRREMGVEWMGRYEARETVPPVYTELIGHQLLAHIGAVAA